ncbi:MAG: UDP-2,4-diacetamido-2,4,6-trideoxy-beta-L-altropyranose hydrolase [Thiomicrorhabdus sp.]|nr:UDP-2,4-diacetamido-2,4,6-trideoxy-beta-L-altropyranose hydrolase [Thiomicrorhabdus sp.]
MANFLNTVDLKDFLESKAVQYNSPKFIESDPIQVPHKFSKKEDIEIAAFLTATIAWGNRKSIIKNAKHMMQLLDNAPYDFVMQHQELDLKQLLPFVHRTFNATDFSYFITALQHIYKKHNGLEAIFTPKEGENTQDVIANFKQVFFEIEHPIRTTKHVSNPQKGSAAKRINMFLRWMVRNDNAGVDFGIWKNINPALLSCPLDVHSGNVARKLGLLNRKQNDAKACITLLESIQPDWLVVDHYALDVFWQTLLQGTYQKLMVIDDLADRNHACHLLLDQTVGRKRGDYQYRVPSDCQCLLGSNYGLLRAEFVQWRQLKTNHNSEIKRLLITLGGVDQQNMTCQVLEGIQNCQLSKELEIVVVMGEQAPHLSEVKLLAQTISYQTTVKVNVSNMAELMAKSDVVISAAGSTVWEVACVGTPLIFLQTADNQQMIAAALRVRQAALEIRKEHIKKDILQIEQMDLAHRQALSSAIAQLSDGRGAERVAKIMRDYVKGVPH